MSSSALQYSARATELAKQYRQDENSREYVGGVVIVFKDQVGGWVNTLRDPQSWEPGCIAVAEDGKQWVAMGGNADDGAKYWEAVADDHQPKGSMCQACEKVEDDCSSLDFQSMPIIEQQKGQKVVKCSEFERANSKSEINMMEENKKKPYHLMVDVEAVGKSTSAALVSIGAVFFDPAKPDALYESFYVPIKLSSSQYYEGQIDASTIEWWMKQSDEARAVFNDENRVSLKYALEQFSNFIKHVAGDNEVYVWGNGPAYDNAILSHAFHKTWVKQPWSFSKDTCVRTMVMLGRELGIDPKYDLPRNDVAHNALDDAIHQANYVSVIWQALFAAR